MVEATVVVAGPEHRPGFTEKEYQVETAAAFGAAILGSLLSHSSR